MFIVVLDYSNLKVLSEKELKLFGLDKNNWLNKKEKQYFYQQISIRR
jgi:hypothetical protein